MARPGIVLLDADTLGEVSIYPLTKLGNLTVYQTTDKDQRIGRIQGNEIVITNKVVIDREVMDASPVVKLICVAATGMNNIDLEYAEAKGIRVMNVAGYSTDSVVQLTFSLLFQCMVDTWYYRKFVFNGDYAKSGMFTHHGKPFSELAGKNFGIIGMGTIGRRVAEIASAFKVNVSYYSTSGKNLDAGYRHCSLHDLLIESDIISIHCPLNSSTRDLIGYEQLRIMKSNAILINTGRGGIVNESDLASALDEDLIACATLDVMDKEPPEPTNPLLRLKNPGKLIITPHIAWASLESRERLVAGITENIRNFLENN